MGLTKCIFSKSLTRNIKYIFSQTFSSSSRKPPWKVLFFGADEFSIFSLDSLTQEYRKGNLINKLEVVTTIKGKPNAVKLFCDEKNLTLHKWPPSLSYGQYDVGLVVSFGHLIPREIIQKFEFGMLNVHASLLPRWRGAAPIIYALLNGDRETGITIMKINPHKFDTGQIVRQETVEIEQSMKMSDLHTTLGKIGAKNLTITLESLPASLEGAKPQGPEGITYAPKVNPDLACVKWDKMTSREVYNLARALDGVFNLQTTWRGIPVKLFNVELDSGSNCEKSYPGSAKYDNQKRLLKILCADSTFITVEIVGVLGKKIMTAKDFNNGYVKKEPPDYRYFE